MTTAILRSMWESLRLAMATPAVHMLLQVPVDMPA